MKKASSTSPCSMSLIHMSMDTRTPSNSKPSRTMQMRDMSTVIACTLVMF